MRTTPSRLLCLTALAFALCGTPVLCAQAGDLTGPGPGGAPAMAMGGRMVRGTITAVSPERITLKSETGETFNVVITPNTQLRKGRDLIKLADVHVGDGAGAMGELDAPNHTVHALFLGIVDAEQVRKARESFGKTWLTGTITAIDETKLTILRSDKVTQVIEVDEDTSFKRGGRNMQMALGGGGMGAAIGARSAVGEGARPDGARADAARADGRPHARQGTPQDEGGESITLADVKVGNLIGAQGALKNGIFVPAQLAVTDPALVGNRRHRNEAAAGAEPK